MLYDAIKADTPRPPSPLDMPKRRFLPKARLAWTTMTGDRPLPPKEEKSA